MSVVVDTVVQSLLQNLALLVADEVKLLHGVKEQMESLQNELKFIDIFLKSSNGKRYDLIVKEVVNQIRDVAHKAEDVVDMYTSKVSQHKSRHMLKKLFHIKDHVKMLHSVGVDIGKIKSIIDEIYKNKDRYNIEEGDIKSIDNEVAQSLHRRRRNVDEEDVVHDSTAVNEELEKDSPRRIVVSIIGMGGKGKTTLAKKIYNTLSFPCRAWGDVSNDYRPKELWLSILKCLVDSSQYKDLTQLSEEELKEKVWECLEGKKYLIVLDDIWETKVWDEVQDAFPDDSGGRILITSRNMDVSSHSRVALAHKLPFLDKEDSWKLFSRKVFQEEECPPDLVELGKSMVEGCGGLPLAIIILAGIAYKKKSPQEWLEIKEHVNWHLARETIVEDILKLSYDNLPQRLKPCFLYFAMYPEDYEIRVAKLVQLWIAEGFIQVTGPNPPTLEYVAESYLNELVDLSLVQVARRKSGGGVKTCRIHDLLRDLCISESKDDKFLDVYTSASSNPRRLSCHCIRESCIITSNNKRYQSCIRSLICFHGRNYFHQKHTIKFFVERFKLLRVLDFGSVIYMVPNGLKTLIHLRYLRIHVFSSSEDHDKDILASILCLCNLEVLKINGLDIRTIPSGMWKLNRLRHLHMGSSTNLISKPEIGILSNLQTLGDVYLNPQTPSILNNDRFPNLIKLSLIVNPGHEESFKRLSHLSNLRNLKICSTVNIPSNDAFLSNLTKISLLQLDIYKLDMTGTLGKLTKLQALTISSIQYRNKGPEYNINCVAGDFQNLKVFHISLTRLTNWRLGEGAMLRLERVIIRRCISLEGLPQELWSLTTLQKVEIEEPSPRLDKSLKDGMVMKNGCKIIIIK